MEARRVHKCYFDEELGTFHQECIIAVVNALVGAPVLSNANFESAHIKSSKSSNSNLRLRYYLVHIDGSQHKIPLFFGKKYGNSASTHVNSKYGEYPAEFNENQIELVKAIMRLGAMGGNRPLSMLQGSARNYDGSRHFPGEQEMLARRYENLQQAEVAGGGGGGGAAYQQALVAARAEAREVGRNSYMHNLSAARANVRVSAILNYQRQLEIARRNAREQAMRNYITALGPGTAAKAEGGAEAAGAAAPVVQLNEANNEKTIRAAAFKKGGASKKKVHKRRRATKSQRR